MFDAAGCTECRRPDCNGHLLCPGCNDDLCDECGGCLCPDTYCPGYTTHLNH
ncbi:hypothetical protein ACN20G_16655 [Streptomyces sp. BI20]|uniref:hypothetical protein n=1 Tax=Streptomyces sp. BI20 TaxID=3403460 RepID=UPI003C774053